MPEEEYWETLFDVPLILDALGIDSRLRDVAEFGCGFGTFSVPIAQRISGDLLAFDMDPRMIARTRERATASGVSNVVLRECDVMASGFGLPDASVDAVLLFNILHGEFPETLLRHASRVVRPGGQVLIIHWRYDPRTPRGPDLSIRPRPEQVVAWAQATGELRAAGSAIELPPWHFGLKLLRLGEPI
jgi:SAM-dependent methyltransferase